MPRDDSRPNRDPEGKRPAPALQRAGERADAWMPRRGRSGYGMESIRPHLRAQLEQQKLLHPTFPPETEPDPDLEERSTRRTRK